jgi:hypothetical protein
MPASPSRRRSPSEKTKFVLGLPHDLPATDVVAKAREKGHQVSLHQVHNIRWRAKQGDAKVINRAGKKNAVAKPAKRSAETDASRATIRPAVVRAQFAVRGRRVATTDKANIALTRQTAEHQLLAMVLEFGLHGTNELLMRVRDKVAALASG